MGTSDQLEQDLRESLTHLYDPDHEPSRLLCEVLGCGAQQGPGAVRDALAAAIAGMKADADVPQGARIRRIYDVLSCRYLKGLTQEEVADRLGISPRHLRREQREAVKILATRLWEQAHPTVSNGDEAPPVTARPANWRSQLRQELTSLHRAPAEGVVDAAEALRAVRQVVGVLAARHGIDLEIASPVAPYPVSMHPTALHQTLVAAATELMRKMAGGTISVSIARRGQMVEITIEGTPVSSVAPSEESPIRELLAGCGGTASYRVHDGGLAILLTLPSAERVSVLVIDDNVDLVHFYRRYTTGTRYWISSVSQGKDALQAIRSARPDVIVLDVMLPDIDGWALLRELREDPVARDLPIIVCSVIREEELALALGASVYVPKPVRRQHFLEALDRAVNLAS